MTIDPTKQTFPHLRQSNYLTPPPVLLGLGIMTGAMIPSMDRAVTRVTEKMFNTSLRSPNYQQKVHFDLKKLKLDGRSSALKFLSFRIAVAGPMTQELLYRGLLHHFFLALSKEDTAPQVAVRTVANASLFALSHIEPRLCIKGNTRIVAATFLSGSIYSLLMEKTENLLVPFAAHSTKNVLGLYSFFRKR